MNFKIKKEKRCQYFSPDTASSITFSNALNHYITYANEQHNTIILLCIGTDKITGDCLGPLVGSKLQKMNFPLPFYGTLENPLHASNLSEQLIQIKKKHLNPFILVIDAAVGSKKHVGLVSLSCNPLSPGRGVNRPLTPIGNISITGIVNETSSAIDLLLPYTSLHLVNKLADYICNGITFALKNDFSNTL